MVSFRFCEYGLVPVPGDLVLQSETVVDRMDLKLMHFYYYCFRMVFWPLLRRTVISIQSLM